MNGKDFFDELARRTGYTGEDAARLATSLVDVMAEELQEGKSVDLQDFGTFEVEKQMESVIINPSTGRRFLVPPKLHLRFSPDPEFGNKMKKPSDDE